jgi:general secretion pathway protein A
MTPDTVFSISPNPRFFFLTPSIQAALEKTRYVINASQGLTTIIGDIGLGKTSLLRLLFNEYDDNSHFTAALIVNPKQTSETAFLKAICTELGVRTKRSLRETEYELRSFLISEAQQKRTVVLFVDEAQQLKGPMFEQIRQLLNFETDDKKLINIVMAGQIELRYKLADRSKRALVSRIALSSALDALTLQETGDMIDFRCRVAGTKNPFLADAIETIYQHSKGIPREVIKLCAVAVQYAQMNDLTNIPSELISIASRDIVHPDVVETAAEPGVASQIGVMSETRKV